MIKLLLLSTFAALGLSGLATACPFCSATAQTLRQDMAAMDVVAFGELIPNGKGSSDQSPDEIAGIAEFKIVESLRGEGIVPSGAVVSAPYYGSAKSKGRFLLMGVHQTEVLWSSPLPVTAEAEKYLRAASRLPDDRGERLKFYLTYLENPEPLLARDAYEEFAQTPYEDVKSIRESLSRTQLVDWIKSRDVAPDRKRLYYTLLGICAEKSDALFLETLLKSQDDSERSGLDALVACYLTIVGEAGLPLVEELFLKNSKASYPDTFASVMALRFHGTEGGVIDRQKIVASMRWMLERPDFADLVIPDLARWEDWTQIERLTKLFVEADDSSSWVRVPVVNYLRACPLPEAKAALAELEKVDPKAVKRAATFFPIPQPAAPQSIEPTPSPGAAVPSGKNDTSLLPLSLDPTQPTVMRIPLGARSPLAFKSTLERARFGNTRNPKGERTQLASSGESLTGIELANLDSMGPSVFPDFVLAESGVTMIPKPGELCGMALLSATSLLMFMWMIVASIPERDSSLLQRGWVAIHRWTHGTLQYRRVS